VVLECSEKCWEILKGSRAFLRALSGSGKLYKDAEGFGTLQNTQKRAKLF